MTDLTTLVPSLKRALAAPGEFDTYFPEALDDDLASMLADAMAEAQLDGFLGATDLDVATVSTDPDLSNPQQALVVLYAMSRVLTARIANLKNKTRYKAGSAEAETEQSASVLVELLRDTSARKKALLEEAKAGNVAGAFVMADLYLTKSIDRSDPDVGYIYAVDTRY